MFPEFFRRVSFTVPARGRPLIIGLRLTTPTGSRYSDGPLMNGCYTANDGNVVGTHGELHETKLAVLSASGSYKTPSARPN